MRGLFDDRAHLQANQNRVDAVDLKNRLCDVEADRRNCLHICILRIMGALTARIFIGTRVSVEEPPYHQKRALTGVFGMFAEGAMADSSPPTSETVPYARINIYRS